jgi:ABC-type multidrug transport system ATPase subunit
MTHVVSEVESLADHLGTLKDGRITTQVDRDTLRRTLREYTVGVPDRWDEGYDVQGRVVSQEGTGREQIWTVWGDERDVVARLTAAGATIRDVRPVTLERAARALISTGRHALADTSTEFQPLDPSGEKNGDWAPSVPGNGVAWSWSRSRNISREFSSASPM